MPPVGLNVIPVSPLPEVAAQVFTSPSNALSGPLLFVNPSFLVKSSLQFWELSAGPSWKDATVYFNSNYITTT